MEKVQKQIDWININLKREIEERLAQGDRFRLSAWFLDQRIEKLEKMKQPSVVLGSIIMFSLVLLLIYATQFK